LPQAGVIAGDDRGRLINVNAVRGPHEDAVFAMP